MQSMLTRKVGPTWSIYGGSRYMSNIRAQLSNIYGNGTKNYCKMAHVPNTATTCFRKCPVHVEQVLQHGGNIEDEPHSHTIDKHDGNCRFGKCELSYIHCRIPRFLHK